jgi:hypothetical protein
MGLLIHVYISIFSFLHGDRASVLIFLPDLDAVVASLPS